jgi:two-component system nitrogen regulation sensor histidine kinase GlnL
MDHDTPRYGDPAQRVLENLTTTVLLLDRDLRLSYLNPAGEMLFAVSARHSCGMPLEQLLVNAEQVIAGMRLSLDSGHPYTERELELRLLGDRTIHVDCTVTPLMEPGHDQELLVELLQVDRQLRIVREEHLIAQHNATRALVRGLAHEIKNPLGGLRGAAQLLERELSHDALKEYTRIIIGEADRLQNLMNRMLGPNTLPHKQEVNIHEVLEHVRSLVRAEASGRVKLIADYDPSIPPLTADKDQLIQAVLNIVRNAVQAFGEDGSITLRTRALRQYTIGQKRHKLVVRVDIIDNGPGIPSDMLENIFYPMITGRKDGTGLGLAIAQNLVNQQGGLIECASRPGRTVFSLLLPLEAKDE